jgi:hypothetical protein
MAGGLFITAFGTTMSLEPGGSGILMVLTVTEDINILLKVALLPRRLYLQRIVLLN